MSELATISILLTRPAADTAALARKIEALGGTALQAPMLTITPTVEATDWPASDAHVYATIFTSRYAAQFGFESWQARYGGDDEHQLCAVGPGSAKALEAAGARQVIVPQTFSSEGLLDLEIFGSAKVDGRIILMVKGHGGREYLRDELVARGAQVAAITTYVREKATVSIRDLFRHHGLERTDYAVVTSLEALDHFVTLLRREGLQTALATQLIVPGSRIAEAVLEAGFTCDPLVVDNPANDDIVECLLDHAGHK